MKVVVFFHRSSGVCSVRADLSRSGKFVLLSFLVSTKICPKKGGHSCVFFWKGEGVNGVLIWEMYEIYIYIISYIIIL